MRTLFSLVNFVAGILALMIGFGNFVFLTNQPSGTSAGLLAMGIGATCLWLASKLIPGSKQPG